MLTKTYICDMCGKIIKDEPEDNRYNIAVIETSEVSRSTFGRTAILKKDVCGECFDTIKGLFTDNK